ncbi:pulmonary surfactant-associated protein A [Zophobas morio]
MKFAAEKNGLAFNFSPNELKNYTQGRWFRNCQVLGCPEIRNSSTLVFDAAFDYYTAFGDFNSTQNSTCIKSVGLFSVIETKMNYTDAIYFCQNLGADLANVLSEFRTNTLSALIKPLKNWYKAAYVGLEDMDVEGAFRTPMGTLMECSGFRAWAVGHPRPGRKKEDCVILDADKTWRAINCRIKRPFICEFYPTPPALPVVEFATKDCDKIKNKKKKRQCLNNNELVQLYMNSSRMDQCALVNDFD